MSNIQTNNHGQLVTADDYRIRYCFLFHSADAMVLFNKAPDYIHVHNLRRKARRIYNEACVRFPEELFALPTSLSELREISLMMME